MNIETLCQENIGYAIQYTKPVNENHATGNYGTTINPANQGFGNQFGVGPGYVYDTTKTENTEIYHRIRADEPHKGHEYKHLNDETIINGNTKKPIIGNNHIKIEW